MLGIPPSRDGIKLIDLMPFIRALLSYTRSYNRVVDHGREQPAHIKKSDVGRGRKIT